MNRDLREPRFLFFEERLFLYFFEAGTNPTRFEPGRIFVTAFDPADGWSDPHPISEPGWVVWRPRQLGDLAYMSVYGGGEKIFSTHPEPTRVELWVSKSGTEWNKLALLHEGGTETEFVLLEDNSLLALSRVEGPFGGWGTALIRTGSDFLEDPSPPGEHQIRYLPRKLDSPLMVTILGKVLVVARRQRSFGGRYDLGLTGISATARTRLYQLAYWLTPKTTGIYEVDPEALSLAHLTDIPSKGDTAFPAVPQFDHTGPNSVAFDVYNYSSPPGGLDIPWLVGQLRPTNIYVSRIELSV